MERSISWDWVYEHLKSSCETMDDAIVDELHELFLTKGRKPFSLRGRCMYREIVSEDECVHGYGLPEKPERTFTLGEIVDAAAKRLSLDAGMVIQNVLYALLGEDGTKEERKKVDSISSRIIKREERACGKQEMKGRFDFTTKKENNMEDNNTPQGGNITNNFEGAHIGRIVYNYGTINENNYGQSEMMREDERDPYEALLLKIIEPLKNERNWKALLLPYCAAIVEGVLPLWPHALFVQKTGIAVPSTPYSVWTKKDRFTHDELEPYAERFEQLKRQIDNSK